MLQWPTIEVKYRRDLPVKRNLPIAIIYQYRVQCLENRSLKNPNLLNYSSLQISSDAKFLVTSHVNQSI